MDAHRKVPIPRLETSLSIFYGLLILSLLIIFVVEPSIYTTTLSPGLSGTERYPLPAILFLVAIVSFVSILMFLYILHGFNRFMPGL